MRYKFAKEALQMLYFFFIIQIDIMNLFIIYSMFKYFLLNNFKLFIDSF
jgi:hypothetical protein